MANVFKKLIRNELGESSYKKYFIFTKCNIHNRRDDNQLVFDDMYNKLKYRDVKTISKMHSRLNDTLLLALKINKNFLFAFFFYLFASLYIILKGLSFNMTITSLSIMGVCFLYKLFEFIANKFCYVDAQIVLIYKSVLDKIILNEIKKD